MPLDTRSATPAGLGNEGKGSPSSEKGFFRKEGEYWTVGYANTAIRLKDTKGLSYLAHLLRYPGIEFHVLDLVGGIAADVGADEANRTMLGSLRRDGDLEKAGINIGRLGDAGDMLDDQAKAAYRRRLSELRLELQEAKELGKVDRAEHTEDEIESLTRELSRAVGLGGRDRRAASASERARQSVSKSIKSVLERIAESAAVLGDILSRDIKTGTLCSYRPDPDSPIAWEFAATSSEPTEQPTISGGPAPGRAEHPQASPTILEVCPFSLAERTAFVGRGSERAEIRAAIDGALAGRGAVIMLGGEPGVGKTRLAMEMAECASRIGFRCAVGHSYERDEPFPYLPFVEIIESSLAQAASLDDYRRQLADNAPELAQIAPRLRRIFPDIPEPPELPPEQRRRYLFQSLSDALARASRVRPQLQILDDLQWADESTLALLIHLANRVAPLRIVIIGTYRDGDSESNPALVRTLEELIRMGIRPINLGGLSKTGVAEMLKVLSDSRIPESLVNTIFEESQGFPFFIEEVYRHLVEEEKVFDGAGDFRTDIEFNEIDVPKNVRLIIGRRLGRLEDNQRRVLAAAAVIGRSFSFQLLIAISRIDIDELFTVIEKAQEMGIIVPSSDGPEKPLTFAHELVRQTLLEGISAPRRQQLNARVAGAIEQLDPAAINERAGEIADHLLKAGSFADRKALVHWLGLAGSRALEVAAFGEAQRNFKSALSQLGAVDEGKRAELLRHLATAERGLERWDEALINLREMLEIYIRLGDRALIGRGFTELTDTLVWAGRFQEAAETAHHGLAYLRNDISADRARLLAASGHAYATAAGYESDPEARGEGLEVAFQLPTERYGPAHEALQGALNIASQLSDRNLEARLLSARSILNFHFFRLNEAAADGSLSEELGGSGASPWQRSIQLRVLHSTLLHLGRLKEALKVADDLEPLARKIGQSYSLAICLSTRAWAEFAKAPDLARLEIDCQQVSKSDQRARFAFLDVLSEVQLTLIDFFRGNWTNALRHAQASRRDSRRSFGDLGAGILFRQMAYSGDCDGAFAILEETREWLPVIAEPNTRGSWWMLALVIEGLVIMGERSQAGQLYPLVRELLGTGAVALWPIARFSQTIAGAAAAAAGKWETAEQHFQIARLQADSFPNRFEQTEIRRFHAMMLIDRGVSADREKAQALLSEALESYSKIGMPRHIEMTRALLDKAG